MESARNGLSIAGRVLLGLYFLIPGAMKITGFDATAEYMATKGMVAIPLFLVATIVLQIGGALCLFTGYRVALAAFLLAGLTLVINLVMHDFWALEAGLQQQHETQNFIKNLAIMAGLLVVAGGNVHWRLPMLR